MALACLYLCLRMNNRGMYRELLADGGIRRISEKMGLGISKPDNDAQFFLFTTLTDTNFAGYTLELASALGTP